MTGMEIKNYIISEDKTIIDAMNLINKNGKGIAYVCASGVLKAAISDGDVRRHILNKGSLKAPISEVANYSPIYAKRQDGINYDLFMKEKQLSSLPIINEAGEIITIKFSGCDTAHTTSNLNTPVVIMAGGKGSRLLPMTSVLPKPLIPIDEEKTITELIMDKFMEYGCSDFNMIVNYKKELIKAYFLDCETKYKTEFTEEKEFLGTGGGLNLLRGKYDKSFFMTNCDILIEEDYGEIMKFHQGEKNIITMVCALKTTEVPYGTVELNQDGDVKRLLEKPSITHMINTGFYVIEPGFLEYIPKDTFIHITEVISNCIEQGEKVGAYPISENSWSDMGQIVEMEKMIREYEMKGKY